MKPITIKKAKEIANEIGAIGIIILAFDDEKYKAVSYGQTKADCREMRRLIEDIADQLESGELKAWSGECYE